MPQARVRSRVEGESDRPPRLTRVPGEVSPNETEATASDTRTLLPLLDLDTLQETVQLAPA